MASSFDTSRLQQQQQHHHHHHNYSHPPASSSASTISANNTTKPPSTHSSSSKPKPLTGPEERFFSELFFQSQDAASPHPILGDPYAQQFINRLPPQTDFGHAVFSTEPRTWKTMVARIKLHDDWVQDFLDAHSALGQKVTVLNLSCGLDSRNLRIRRSHTDVRWVDVEGREGMALRRSLMPSELSSGDYTTIAADVAGDDFSWLAAIPGDRPTAIIADELLMWLRPNEGKRLINRVVEHFPRGQFSADVVGTLMKEMMWLMPLLKGAKVRFLWAVNDARELEHQHRKLVFRETVRWYELLGKQSSRDEEAAPWFGKWTGIAGRILPGFKNTAQVVLLDFNDEKRAVQQQGQQGQGEGGQQQGQRHRRSGSLGGSGVMMGRYEQQQQRAQQQQYQQQQQQQHQMPPPSRRTMDSVLTTGGGSSIGGRTTTETISSEGSQWSESNHSATSYSGVSRKGSANALGGGGKTTMTTTTTTSATRKSSKEAGYGGYGWT